MKSRLKELRKRMEAADIDAAILVHPRDVLYYAGTARPATLLVGPRTEWLFVRRGLEYARQEASIKKVTDQGKGLDAIVKALEKQKLTGKRLGLVMDVLSARLYQKIQQTLPKWTLVDISSVVLAQRMIKDSQEISLIEQAAAITDAGHAAIAQTLRPGMTELEAVAHAEMAMRQAGHEGYQSHRHPGSRGGGALLVSGENLQVRGGHGLIVTGGGLSPGTPYGPSQRQLCPGDLVMMDTGSTYQGYTADQARPYVVGEATEIQHALFEATLVTQASILSLLVPGTLSISEIYATAEQMIAPGIPPHFAPGDLVLPGFVGHGVGYELDEPPIIWDRDETQLEAGMTLAIEVEVSAPSAGMMVKIEDTVVIEADGPRLLTAAPRKLIQVDSKA